MHGTLEPVARAAARRGPTPSPAEPARRIEARQDVKLEIEAGALMVEAAARRVGGADGTRLSTLAQILRKDGSSMAAAPRGELEMLMKQHADRSESTNYDKELRVIVEPERARHGAWYEGFP